MHEFSLLASLMKKIDQVVADHHAQKVRTVKVKLGALAHISADHFREHFEHAAKGTPSEHAHLDIVTATDEKAPDAQDIVLESVEVEA